MSKDEVVTTMGKPSGVERRDKFEFWAYDFYSSSPRVVEPTDLNYRSAFPPSKADFSHRSADGSVTTGRAQTRKLRYHVILSDDRVIDHGARLHTQSWYEKHATAAASANVSIASVRKLKTRSDGRTEFRIVVIYELPANLKEATIEAGVSIRGSPGDFKLQEVDQPLGQVEITVLVPIKEADRTVEPTVFTILRKRTQQNQGRGNTLAECSLGYGWFQY